MVRVNLAMAKPINSLRERATFGTFLTPSKAPLMRNVKQFRQKRFSSMHCVNNVIVNKKIRSMSGDLDYSNLKLKNEWGCRVKAPVVGKYFD